MSIYELFRAVLGRAPDDETLRDLPSDSECGIDCALAIVTARALLDHAHKAGGETWEVSTSIVRAAERVVSVYWRG